MVLVTWRIKKRRNAQLAWVLILCSKASNKQRPAPDAFIWCWSFECWRNAAKTEPCQKAACMRASRLHNLRTARICSSSSIRWRVVTQKVTHATKWTTFFRVHDWSPRNVLGCTIKLLVGCFQDDVPDFVTLGSDWETLIETAYASMQYVVTVLEFVPICSLMYGNVVMLNSKPTNNDWIECPSSPLSVFFVFF